MTEAMVTIGKKAASTTIARPGTRKLARGGTRAIIPSEIG